MVNHFLKVTLRWAKTKGKTATFKIHTLLHFVSGISVHWGKEGDYRSGSDQGGQFMLIGIERNARFLVKFNTRNSGCG